MNAITNNNIQIDYFEEVLKNGLLMKTWSIGNNDYKFNGVGYKPFSTLTVYNDGKEQWVNKGKLTNPITENNITYSNNDYICFYRDGKVMWGITEKDYIIYDVSIPKGSKLVKNPTGRITRCTLSKDTVVNGIPCRKGDIIDFKRTGEIRHIYKSWL